MLIVATGGGALSLRAQSNVPTDILIVPPSPRVSTNCAMPSDLQCLSQEDLASRRVNNWLSTVGYCWYPPLPWNWCAGRTDVTYWVSATLGTDTVLIDDRALAQSYKDWQAARQMSRSMGRLTLDDVPPVPGGDGDPGSDDPQDWTYGSYGPDDLWLEIIRVDQTNGWADLWLHGTVPGDLYQLEARTNLNDRGDWILDLYESGTPGTNQTFFRATLYSAPLFWRAHHTNVVLNIQAIQDAIEPNSATGDPGQSGRFFIFADYLNTNLTVQFHITGGATNGSDYDTITNFVTLNHDVPSATVTIDPIEHNDLDFDKTVTLSIFQTNSYLVEPTAGSATIVIHDNLVTNLFEVVATNLDDPTGMDYHPPTQSLIVALGNVFGVSQTFVRIDTNGVNNTWSPMALGAVEVKIATAKRTVGGFTNGDLFFCNNDFAGVGWVSSNALSWVTNWTTLTNDSRLAQGGFYIDQTGIFSNQLIAVTGQGSSEGAGVWRVDGQGHSTLLTELTNQMHCEGVITLSNDVTHFGPLAGKIVTGAEQESPENPLIFAIDATNGITTLGLGVSCEHFDVIPPNQDLYLLSEDDRGGSVVLKLSHTLLTNYVGDLLITQGGRYIGQPELYIMHWDGGRFRAHGIPLHYYSNGVHTPTEVEAAIFAPISIPPLP